MYKDHDLVVDTFLSKKSSINVRRVCIAGFGDDNLQTYLCFRILEIFLENYSFIKIFENKSDFPCIRFGIRENILGKISFFKFLEDEKGLNSKGVFILNFYEEDYPCLLNLINLNVVEKYIFIVGKQTKDLLRAKEVILRCLQNSSSYIGVFFSRVNSKNFSKKIFDIFCSLHNESKNKLFYLGNIYPEFDIIKKVLLGISNTSSLTSEEMKILSFLVDYLKK